VPWLHIQLLIEYRIKNRANCNELQLTYLKLSSALLGVEGMTEEWSGF
jgi:hypothetical protein